MMNLELLEFHYFDDILTDMKLTPVSYAHLERVQVVILVPGYFQIGVGVFLALNMLAY